MASRIISGYYGWLLNFVTPSINSDSAIFCFIRNKLNKHDQTTATVHEYQRLRTTSPYVSRSKPSSLVAADHQGTEALHPDRSLIAGAARVGGNLTVHRPIIFGQEALFLGALPSTTAVRSC